MFDNVATFLKSEIVQNSIGQEIDVFTERTVFVKPRSVYSNDFYQAAQLGLKPSLVLILSNYMDYEGERLVDFEGVRYNVIRVYRKDESDSLEITLEERTGNERFDESE